MRGGGPVHVGQGRPGFDGHESVFHIDLHTAQLAQIQHEAAVDSAVAGNVVPAAADGQRQAGAPGRVQDGINVSDGARPDDRPRPHVDHAVPYRPGLVVRRILRFDHRPRQAPAQLLQGAVHVAALLFLMHCAHRSAASVPWGWHPWSNSGIDLAGVGAAG